MPEDPSRIKVIKGIFKLPTILEAIEVASDSEEDCEVTIIEMETGPETKEMQKQLQELTLRLEALTTSLNTERQERQRLETLLRQHQQNEEPSMVTSSTSSMSAVSTATHPFLVSKPDTPAIVFTTPSIPNTYTSSAKVSSPTSVFQASSSGCLSGATMPSLYSTYSSPSTYQMQPNQTSTTDSVVTIRSTSTIPTFLQPINAPQPFNQLWHQSQTPPTPFPNYTSQGNDHGCGAYKKLHDLPEFNGRPEEWPMFCVAYLESTNLFKYSKLDNLFRLQKSIKGPAREVVESLLIHPNNVDDVMVALESQFGRPESLIQSQLKKVRDVTAIAENKLEQLIPFATKVRNLAVFFEASGLQQHMADPTLLEELVSKLPMSRRMEWVMVSADIQPFANIKHFSEWLNRVARIVCLATTSSLPTPAQVRFEPRTRSASILHMEDSPAPKNNCRCCSDGKHSLFDCFKFKNFDSEAKWDFVKRNMLCFSCLKYGHGIRMCRQKRVCKIKGCTKHHHSILHDEDSTSSESLGNIDDQNNVLFQKPLLNCSDDNEVKIFFRVLPVRLFNGCEMVRTFALLDEGSSVTIMSSNLAKRLKVTGKAKDLNLRWFGRESKSNKTVVVDIQISADHEDSERFAMSGVYAVDGLCLPTQTFNPKEFLDDDLRTIPLVELKNASPEILIGLDNSHLGAPIRTVNSENERLIAMQTKLGWVIYGVSLDSSEKSTTVDSVSLFCNHNPEGDLRLEQAVDNFFRIESSGVEKPTKKYLCDEDQRALSILGSSTVRIHNRFQTGLLWREDSPILPDSFYLAKRRFHSLESRMKKDAEFGTTYKDIVASYVRKGYARKLSCVEASIRSPRTWYLPHFGVENPNKPGKLRLVFDAAAEVDGRSLNYFLLKGPDDYRPLLEVLFNFRMRSIAVVGDIKEMFHQVLIKPEDQDSQRFLWREEENGPIEVYLMKVMTFGAKCSPCIANFIKNHNAASFKREYPRAVKAIIKNHYVDDYVDSFDTIEEASNVTKAVVNIHRCGGFELRNIMSNSEEVLRCVGEYNSAEIINPKRGLDMNIDGLLAPEKVLGMYWDSLEDVFVFQLNFARISREIINQEKRPTKREFLGITMSIFDPFGMIANFTLYLKLLLRSLWRLGIDWDMEIPDELFMKWQQWKQELPKLTVLKVPRCHSRHLTTSCLVELHTFVDASEESYSAVTYIRVEFSGSICVSFVCGKTRGNPKKLLSMPRLELSAAVLGVRLSDSIVSCYKMSFVNIMFWTDSKTVLHWIRTDPRRHKEFVAFRIAEILETSKVNQWRWVPSKQNSADEATRAKYPPNFRADNNWIKGPPFLSNDECEWPRMPDDFTVHECTEELRQNYVLHAEMSKECFFDANRFSSFIRMKRSIAWAIRYIKVYIFLKTEERGELTALEVDFAEQVICKQVQKFKFWDEIATLQKGLPLKKRSEIIKLTPYLDEFGLLRVYGRIDAAATLPMSTRRPIIMPKDHPVTILLIDQFHRRFAHQNDDVVVNEIRQKFWVIGLRNAVKKVRNKCPLCRIRSARPAPPIMGQLPEDRLTPSVRPFTYTGMDYFGPVSVTIGRRKEKRWVALFTCLTVRAIHLEVSADLSTDACILSIRNFCNRRGVPLRIRSDNGTNFIGAEKELASNKIFDNEAIIQWVFNCPANPHAGGCWERLVQSVKRVLSRTLTEISPRLETLQSALIEAENIVNSRPLTHLPVSTEEEEPLTPNHFILGATNSTQSPGVIDPRALCLRKQWKVSQQLKDHFWRRWIREYLPVLTRRCKWFQEVPPIAVGQLVLVCDVDVPRSQWIRGRVTRVFPGPDGQVRSAEVRTAKGIYRRPAVKIAVLDIGETSD